MEKIKVESIVIKKEGQYDGKPYKIYTVTDATGTSYDTFDYLEPGQEYEGEIKENPPYSPQFKLNKENGGGKKFPGKNYDFEKKRVALEQTVTLIASGHIKMENLIECRDKFFNYLNS